MSNCPTEQYLWAFQVLYFLAISTFLKHRKSHMVHIFTRFWWFIEIMEIKTKLPTTSCRKSKGNFHSMRILWIKTIMLVEVPSKSCLDALNGNEFDEKNIASNSSKYSNRKKFTLIMKLAILGMHEPSTSLSNTYIISLTLFRIFVQSHKIYGIIFFHLCIVGLQLIPVLAFEYLDALINECQIILLILKIYWITKLYYKLVKYYHIFVV